MPAHSKKKEKKQERKSRKAKDKVVGEDSKPSADSNENKAEEEEPPFLTPLSEDEKQYLINLISEDGQKVVWWEEEEKGRILLGLMKPKDEMSVAHLDILEYHAWGDRKQIEADIKTAEVENKIFCDKYPGDRRGSTAASSGRLYIRTWDIIEQHLPLWKQYLEKIKVVTHRRWLRKKVKRDGNLFTEEDRVVIKKLWVGKAVSKKENVGKGNAGVFYKHADEYGTTSEERIIATICDATDGCGKEMGFDFLGEEVRFKAPHGTVVIMDKVASGADKTNRYRHFIEGAVGTYVLVVEVGYAVGNEGDLDKYVEKSKEELEMKDFKKHKNGE